MELFLSSYFNIICAKSCGNNLNNDLYEQYANFSSLFTLWCLEVQSDYGVMMQVNVFSYYYKN